MKKIFTVHAWQHKAVSPGDVYNDMRTIEKVSVLAATVRKYLLLLGAVALVWFTYTALNDVSLMELNFTQ